MKSAKFSFPGLLAAALVALLASACGPSETLGDEDTIDEEEGAIPTWEEFLDSVYKEPFEYGVYIVNGDTPVENEKLLREFYDQLYTSALIVHQNGGVDAKWNSTQQVNLTYCVSNSFGSNKTALVNAMNTATANWEGAANVNFIHVTSQDSNCTATNSNVLFDVRPTSGASYLARAFFPGQSRSTRNVIVDTSAFNSGWPLSGILGHELGHALGFRHEHTRPEAGTCFEDNSWRPLTPYDSTSIMHYPQCNGTGTPLVMSANDRAGAASLYGPPGGNPPPPPPPPPPPGGEEQTGSDSRSIARGQTVRYTGIAVTPGSRFEASITGSGDADLYVRWGSSPTFSSWNCRPYLNGSNESCALDVPSNQTSAHIMIYGYSSASYTLTAHWFGPVQ